MAVLRGVGKGDRPATFARWRVNMAIVFALFAISRMVQVLVVCLPVVPTTAQMASRAVLAVGLLPDFSLVLVIGIDAKCVARLADAEPTDPATNCSSFLTQLRLGPKWLNVISVVALAC